MDRRVMRAVASVEGCTYGQLVNLVVDDRMVFTSALNTAVRVRGSVRHLLQHNVVTISPELLIAAFHQTPLSSCRMSDGS